MPTLDWIGKQAVANHHKEVPYRLIHCDGDRSAGDRDSGNLLVQGDNLEALKALLPYYRGQVKCIYIDPPYNTGNESWVYNDNVNSPEIHAWLDKTVGKEGEDLSRHDKWLCMMYPRLKLLRQFLCRTGVVVVHIDEHEASSLTLLLDEFFGRTNKLGEVVWDKRNPKGDAGAISYQHELLIWYALDAAYLQKTSTIETPKPNAARIISKAGSIFKKVGKQYVPPQLTNSIQILKSDSFFGEHCPLAVEQLDAIPKALLGRTFTIDDANLEFRNWLNDQSSFLAGEKAYKHLNNNGRVYRLASMAWPNTNPAPKEYFRPLVHPQTHQPCVVPEKGWRNPPDTMERLLADDLIAFGDDHHKQPERIYFLDENLSTNFSSLIYFGGSDATLHKNLGLNFENPKPLEIAKKIIGSISENDLILDSFAGSGTTGHAVLDLNKQDGGDRRFILVEMDKDISENVTAQRLTKVIDGYDKGGDPDKPVEGLGGGFRFCTLGEPLFDAMGYINTEVKFAHLAAHLFFIETGNPIPASVDGSEACIGIHGDMYLYLLFVPQHLGSQHPEEGNVLSPEILDALIPTGSPPQARHVIYAEGCTVSEDRLKAASVTYKQIPYKIEGV